jgi:hypothetical protein
MSILTPVYREHFLNLVDCVFTRIELFNDDYQVITALHSDTVRVFIRMSARSVVKIWFDYVADPYCSNVEDLCP